MNQLPMTKIWTGDGFSASPITLNQIQRSEKVALYERITKAGVHQGFEVFLIKLRLKGQPLPGGLFEQDDREVYPSASGGFGKIAWHIMDKGAALQRYDELQKKADGIVVEDTDDVDDSVRIPVATVAPQAGEFTVAEYAEKKKLTYPLGYVALKAEIAAGTIKFVRSERRNARGKATNLYIKKP